MSDSSSCPARVDALRSTAGHDIRPRRHLTPHHLWQANSTSLLSTSKESVQELRKNQCFSFHCFPLPAFFPRLLRMDIGNLVNGYGTQTACQQAEGTHQNMDALRSNLAALLRQYDQEGGSNTCSMAALRDRFASLVPYTNLYFLLRFSEFALSAIEFDKQHGRALFPIGGVLLSPDIPVHLTTPVVLRAADFRGFHGRHPAQRDEHQDQQPDTDQQEQARREQEQQERERQLLLRREQERQDDDHREQERQIDLQRQRN